MSFNSLPIHRQLRVKRQTFRDDLTAGLVMAVISIPNGIRGIWPSRISPAEKETRFMPPANSL